VDEAREEAQVEARDEAQVEARDEAQVRRAMRKRKKEKEE
jgi:hypothetical protein